MEKSETLQEFYKRKFNWHPEDLKNELGHFNFFRLESYIEGQLKAALYQKRHFIR